MKKIFLAVILTMACASLAMAFDGAGGPEGCPRFHKGQMTPEMRANCDKMRSLHEQLRVELAKPTVDKAKARTIHQDIKKLRNEISDARFEEILKDPAKFANRCDRPKGPNGQGRPKLSAEARAKMDELRKLSDEVGAEFKKQSIDKTKIRSLCSKMQTIRNKMDNERLEEMLKDPSKYKDCRFFGGPGPRGGRPCEGWDGSKKIQK